MTDFEILKQDIEKYVRSGMTEANRQRLVAQAAQIGINAGQLVMLIKNAELELKFATGASNTDFPGEAGSGFMTASDAREPQGSGFVGGDQASGFVSDTDTDAEPRPTDHPLASQFSEIRKMDAPGAMSDVYTAIHEGRRKVIIKRIKSQHRSNPQYVDLFYKEFENGFGLDCPNIVRFFGKGEDAEGPFYYMEYVDGRTLTEYIHKEKHNNPEEIRKILLQLLEALKYLHARQIYHRDLKPDNILITRKGDNVKLIDFGLAAADSLVDNLAKAGTPRYAAPELMARAQLADHRSDIYSVGMIIIEIFAKVPNRHHLMDIPHELYRAMADKATMAVPKDRYQSCDEMISLLQQRSNPIPKWLEDKIKEYAADGFISRNERLVLDKEISRAGVDRELVEAMISDELEKAIDLKRKQEVMRRNNAAMAQANEESKPRKGGFSKFLKVLVGIVLAIVVLFALFMVFDNYNFRHSNSEGHGKVVSATHFTKGGRAVTTTKVNFRELASTGSRVLKTLERNTEVEVISELYEWVEVRVDGRRGYIYKEYLIPINN